MKTTSRTIPGCATLLAAMLLPAAAQAADEARLTARTLGDVHSRVLPHLEQELRGSLRTVRKVPGSRSVDITVVDGDAIGGRRLARMDRVRRNLAAGRWILALDVSDQDRRAIQRLTGFHAGTGFASAVLFRRDAGDDEDQIRIVESPVTTRRAADRRPRQAARWTAEMVADELRASVAPGPRARAAAGATLPAELLHVQWSYTTRGTGRPDRPASLNSRIDQTASWLVNYTYDAYLDNRGQRPQGSYQWLTAKVDGSFTPKQANEEFSGRWWNSIGFWTGAAAMDVGPVPADQPALSLVQTSPETENTETQYTSGTTFSVGFKGTAGASREQGPNVGAGIDLAYEVTDSKTWKVTDWAVRGISEPATDLAAWQFSSRNPCDFRDLVPTLARGCFGTAYRSPIEPNELSKGNVPFHTSVVWKTDTVLRRPVTFTTGLRFWLVNTYSENCLIPCYDQSWHITKLTPDAGRHQIDVGAVVPVGVKGLTFSPGRRVPAGTEVTAGTPVTGTLTLASAAPMDLTIPILSSTPNATVDATVSIPKGSSTGTFRILTNDNGLRPGERLTATIAAFYAEPTREQLVLERPAS